MLYGVGFLTSSESREIVSKSHIIPRVDRFSASWRHVTILDSAAATLTFVTTTIASRGIVDVQQKRPNIRL